MSNTKIQSSVLGASGEHLVLKMHLRKGLLKVSDIKSIERHI